MYDILGTEEGFNLQEALQKTFQAPLEPMKLNSTQLNSASVEWPPRLSRLPRLKMIASEAISESFL